MPDVIRDIVFVISYDAYADAAKHVARALQGRVETMRFLIITQDGKPFFSGARLTALEALGEVSYVDAGAVPQQTLRVKADAYFLFFAGSNIEKTVRAAHSEHTHPAICVTCFAGVLFYRQENGFAQRLTSDAILFNSRRNFDDYKAYCERKRASSQNGLIFGFPSLLHAQPRQDWASPPRRIAYIDQNMSLGSVADQQYLARNLIAYAHRFPARELLVLCRDSNHNRSAHTVHYRLDSLLLEEAGGTLPTNLHVSTCPAEEVLPEIDLCIGIASTVLVQAISRGIPTVVLTDFGWKPHLGNLLFQGSGVEMSFQTLLDDAEIASPSKAWVDANIVGPERPVDLLLTRLLSIQNAKRRHIENDAVAKAQSGPIPRWFRRVHSWARKLQLIR